MRFGTYTVSHLPRHLYVKPSAYSSDLARDRERERERAWDRDRRCAPEPADRPALRDGVGDRFARAPDVVVVVRKSAIRLYRINQLICSTSGLHPLIETHQTVSVHIPSILLMAMFSTLTADIRHLVGIPVGKVAGVCSGCVGRHI